MYLIDLTKIETGDIILTRSNSRESIVIREYTKCDYSHAILYVGVSSCIESDGLGVQSQNIQRMLFENSNDAVALRLKDKKLKVLLPNTTIFARQKIGTEYSGAEAQLARHEVKLKAKEENRQFCTRFVAQAYFESGIKIVNNPDYCSPKDILESLQLDQINGILKKANDKEIAFANEKNTLLEKQIAVHNYILESSRNITGKDIQTFENLSKYVLENPNNEKDITDIIEKSGYLELWKIEFEANPWHYNYNEFLKHYKNPIQRKEVGLLFATTEKQTRERFLMTLNTLKFGYSLYKQRYFEIQIELYEKLISLSLQREELGHIALRE